MGHFPLLDPNPNTDPDPDPIGIRIRNPGLYTHMCEAGGLHAGDNDRRIAAYTEPVPLVVFLPANQKMSSLNIWTLINWE